MVEGNGKWGKTQWTEGWPSWLTPERLEQLKTILPEICVYFGYDPRTQEMTGNKEEQFKRIVTKYLLEFGIPPHVNGFQQLRFAIAHAAEHPETLEPLEGLYAIVAEEYEKNELTLQQSMRRAVLLGWDLKSSKDIERWMDILSKKGTPVLGKFIKRAVNELRGE